jgi:hypothetical protein
MLSAFNRDFNVVPVTRETTVGNFDFERLVEDYEYESGAGDDDLHYFKLMMESVFDGQFVELGEMEDASPKDRFLLGTFRQTIESNDATFVQYYDKTFVYAKPNVDVLTDYAVPAKAIRIDVDADVRFLRVNEFTFPESQYTVLDYRGRSLDAAQKDAAEAAAVDAKGVKLVIIINEDGSFEHINSTEDDEDFAERIYIMKRLVVSVEDI